MDKKISIINTRDNEFEFDISINGVDKKNMAVSFVIETNGLNLQFPCKEEKGKDNKWSVVVPPMPLLELATYPFCITIVVDGYFFTPFKGTTMVIHEPTVGAAETKKISPPVVKSVSMKGTDEDEEEVEEPVAKKKPAKKKAKKKVVKKKAAVKEEPVKEDIQPEEPVVEEEPIQEEIEETPEVEEIHIEEEPKDTFQDMADILLKKRRIPKAHIAYGKQDDAVQGILEDLNTDAVEPLTEMPAQKIPTSKHGTFAATIDPTLEKKPEGKKDHLVQDILSHDKKK